MALATVVASLSVKNFWTSLTKLSFFHWSYCMFGNIFSIWWISCKFWRNWNWQNDED